uniref:Uncharacterized protein n=1 Tax=Glossina pallidipes TaxID=7398 RepID=A0A1A9Z8S8_GLOPL
MHKMDPIGEPAQNGVYKKSPLICSLLDPNAWFKPERLHPQGKSSFFIFFFFSFLNCMQWIIKIL